MTEHLVAGFETYRYKDYLTFKGRIKKATTVLKFEISGQEVKPSVRTGKAALQDTKNFFFFVSNDCVLK